MPSGRFAPSPTGDLHLGNLRTALVAWLWARHDGARFTLRIDDLDRVTSSEANAVRQLDDLRSLGIDWDGDVERSSDHFNRYDAAIGRLEQAGLVYRCYCTRREIAEAAAAPHGVVGRYPGVCRDLTESERARREADGRRPALRLRGTGRSVTFVDALAGPTTGMIDDVVLRRSDGVPAYQLAVVVDDVADGVELVVRGDDLLSSTPTQIHLAGLLGWRSPGYAHVPLVLNHRGDRLAKRDGAVTLADRAARGESVAATRTLLAASLGLCRRDEHIDLATLRSRFDPSRLPRTPWCWNEPGATG